MMAKTCGVLCVISLAQAARALGQECDVALQFVQLEAAGKFAEANRLLDISVELAVFRDHPAFPPGRRPSSLSGAEYEVLRALGALVTFRLVRCQGVLFFPVLASIEVTRPDFLRLFPGRTEGVSILVPKDAAEREAFLKLLRSRFGDLVSIPMVREEISIPIVSTKTGPKVGLRP